MSRAQDLGHASPTLTTAFLGESTAQRGLVNIRFLTFYARTTSRTTDSLDTYISPRGASSPVHDACALRHYS
eukprot:6197415-Pleurochrysis_carterae.AAC.2